MASSAHLLFLIILTLSPLASLGDIPELNQIAAELNGEGGHGGDHHAALVGGEGGHGGDHHAAPAGGEGGHGGDHHAAPAGDHHAGEGGDHHAGDHHAGEGGDHHAGEGGNGGGANLDNLAAQLLAGASAAEGGEPIFATCMPKLLPCKDFINAPTPPPETCCGPLKEIVKDQTKCLCQVMNNPSLLKSFNVTQEEVLKLPKACNVPVDLSICDHATAPSPSMSLPTIPKDPSPPADGESDDKKNSASGLSMLGGYGVITLFISLFIPGAF